MKRTDWRAGKTTKHKDGAGEWGAKRTCTPREKRRWIKRNKRVRSSKKI